ncbi:SDR family oxidoreductase [Dictyobacter aurantiacus]|uniref:Putative oxidoreductase UxuB n=1 Tax=Dictyobacter aurantiacus TaxID=1936993 RepID=A0A401ZS37_9CHLR|nr:SDR family oxidoreductase [Dictyobacter aurantiacus]GCE09616.1 putative oxidoreductase UxuB [Dictyobacter aurantiacus]
MSYESQLQHLFNVEGQTAVITGGSGGLGSAMAYALAQAGVKVAILSRHEESSRNVAEKIQAQGGSALGLACDVVDRTSLEQALEQIIRTFGPVDILVNGAGGNHPSATTSPERSFFDLDNEAVDHVFDLNFSGTLKCCQVFGRGMAERKQGCIINIASMNSLRPLTRIPAYSASKAAITNFTQWLAVHMAQEYSPAIRVNAIAPGFFLTNQNRFMLTDEKTGGFTARGETIVAHTPMHRLGEAEDLVGTLLWLASPAATFVTGIVVPVDGGFSAFSGV